MTPHQEPAGPRAEHEQRPPKNNGGHVREYTDEEGYWALHALQVGIYEAYGLDHVSCDLSQWEWEATAIGMYFNDPPGDLPHSIFAMGRPVIAFPLEPGEAEQRARLWLPEGVGLEVVVRPDGCQFREIPLSEVSWAPAGALESDEESARRKLLEQVIAEVSDRLSREL